MALRILLAEDEPVTRRTAQALLTRAGHEVTAVEDGAAAVAAATGDPLGFDLILMDLGLPGMAGDEATRAIRALADPRRAGVRILMVTATAVAGDLERCRTCGADGVLSKPLQIDALEAAVSPPPKATGPFDEAVLRQMRELLAHEQVARLIAKAAATLEQYLAALDDALATGDTAAAATMAHKVAGVSGQYGCVALRQAAKALEAAFETGDRAQWQSAYQALTTAFPPAIRWLRGTDRVFFDIREI